MKKTQSNIFEKSFQKASVGMVQMDLEGKILRANDKMADILGVEVSDLIGKDLIDFAHPEDAVIDSNSYERMMSKLIDSYSIEKRYIGSDKEVIWAKFTNHRIDKENGELEFLLGILEDISLRIEIEKDKENMMKKLFQSSKLASLGQLAAGVGHEINNPLAIINGYIELLENKITKNEYSTNEIIKVLEKQKGAVSRIANVVSGLRSYSCDENLEVISLNVHDVLDSVIDMLKKVYESDNIHITTEYTNENFYVLGNFNKLQQVFTNILTNAKDATEGKKRRVIAVKTMFEDNHGIIKISDNGIGMAQEVLEKVFDTFYSTKDVGKGSGLGMGIAKNIIEASGGKIDIKSQYQMGATVSIKLPTVEAENNFFINGIFSKMFGRVLVVEDEIEIRNFLEVILLKFGFQVDAVCDGKQGLELARINKYKYIFTDLKMPVMSGEEMIKKIHKLENFDSKVFVITGIVEKIGMDVLADGCLMKPFDHRKIFNLINQFEEEAQSR